MDTTVTLTVNGQQRTITTDPQRPLLDVLREDMGLTGTKSACGEGRCGACSVLLDGKRVRSCVTAVSKADKKTVVTIEGLANGAELHPIQRAYVEKGAVQCGFCTPGFILSTYALLRENPSPTDEEILTALEGNLCRCTGYTKILEAVRYAAKLMQEAV